MNKNKSKKDIFPLEILKSNGIANVFNSDQILKDLQENKAVSKLSYLPISTACCSITFPTSSELWLENGEVTWQERQDQPINSNLLIFSGMISPQFIPYLKHVYKMMPEKKWVMAIGTCAINGGVFESSPLIKGLDNLFPVDIYVPGCPPTEESVTVGFNLLKEKVLRGECLAQSNTETGANP